MVIFRIGNSIFFRNYTKAHTNERYCNIYIKTWLRLIICDYIFFLIVDMIMIYLQENWWTNVKTHRCYINYVIEQSHTFKNLFKFCFSIINKSILQSFFIYVKESFIAINLSL